MQPFEKEILKPWRVGIIDDSPDDRSEIRRMLLSGSERRLTFVEAGSGRTIQREFYGATYQLGVTINY